MCRKKWKEIMFMIPLYFIPLILYYPFNPRILCSFLLKNIPLFFILTVRNRSFDTVPLNYRIYSGLLLKNTSTGFSFIQKNGDRWPSIPSVESKPMDRWSSVRQGFCDRWSIKKKKSLTDGSINSIDR
jgi:hypothetical protein